MQFLRLARLWLAGAVHVGSGGGPAPSTSKILLENNTDAFLLEDGSGVILIDG